ncbi:MAG: sugar phosphate isomerase/epimerase [Fusobacteriaceae bacterium]|jgi:sugar phosphate isomerase/epimerase|nr:sugar phosphate isomerase/epimerase [Fusobacteriaceae bacterium]
MNFKFSLAHLTILKTSPLEISKIAAECGYDYVSIRQIYMNLLGEDRYELYNDKYMLNEIKSVFRDTGIKLLDIELARVIENTDVGSYEKAFAIGKELGAKHVLNSIWTNKKDYYIEKFAQICDLAKQYDLTVDLECVPIAGVRKLSEAMEVLEVVDRKNAGIMIDTHHIQRAQDDYNDLLKIPDKYFNYCQICDAPSDIPSEREELIRIMREGRDYLGEGGIDVAKILNNMPIIPYSIELPNSTMTTKLGFKGHAKKCLDTAKEYLNKYVTGRK